jgi:2,3-bisphosphoglycerate-dependent phosphoglycerate mutase
LDVDLTAQGRREAAQAGEKLKAIAFAHAFTSVLRRARETLDIILAKSLHPQVPISEDKALNERNYGQLQGLNKAETAAKFGPGQVLLWRRSYAVAPPGGESLKDTVDRVIPYYLKAIQPLLGQGQDILVVAHGNSLRALMMLLESIGPDEIAGIDLPTGIPRIYRFNTALCLLETRYID